MAKVLTFSSAKSSQAAPAELVNIKEPDRRSGLIHRPRPLQLLSDAPASRIVLLQAPAGFGKTALLDLFAAQQERLNRRVVRVTCDHGVVTAPKLVSRLVDALRTAGLIRNGTNALDGMPAVQLVEQLDAAGSQVDLLVDAEASELEKAALEQLWPLALQSRNVRLAVASRRRMTEGLARARAQGRVSVLGADVLRFDSRETRALFSAAGRVLRDAEVSAILTESGAWPLALGALASDRDSTVGRGVAILPNRAKMRDFFQEEVLANIERFARVHLEELAILDRMSAALVDCIIGGTRGKEILTYLTDGGHFTFRVDHEDGWYEFQPIFLAHLRSKEGGLTDERRRQINLAAKEWYLAHGMFLQAYEHAMRAGEIEAAARVLNNHCDDLYLGGFEQSILPATLRLPADLRRQFPRIMLAMSWRMMGEWRFEDAGALLDSVENAFKERAAGNTGRSDEMAALQFEIEHRRIMQALFQDNFCKVDKGAQALLKDVERRANPYIAMSLYSAMMYAQREQFQFGSLDRLEKIAREHLQRVPSRYMHVFFEAMAAPGKLLQGETGVVITQLEEALRTAVEISSPGSPVGATVALILGEARYACNELEQAQALIDDYMPVATSAGFVDQLVSGYVTQARLHRQAGRADAAFAALHEAELVAADWGFHRLGTMAFSERIALLCHLGQATEAVRVAGWEGVKLGAAPEAPKKGSTREDNARAMTWVRLAQARGHLDEALGVAKAWRSFTLAAKAVVSVVEWDILRAQLLLASNEETSAHRALLQALAVAAPARLIRPFVDEATRLTPIFELLINEPAGGAGQGTFQTLILDAVGPVLGSPRSRPVNPEEAPDAFAIADLTARELGILKLVATGQLNAEIARRLGLTAGTVKWYLHRIYGKLGCRRRIKVIEQARRLGLV